MARRKCVCTKWTLILLVVLVCPFVHSRPQETSVKTDLSTESSISATSQKNVGMEVKSEVSSITPVATETPREVKTKVPIRDSIKLVANQLLDKPNITDTPVIDTRIPPKIKSQVKNKIKTKKDDENEKAHAGIAVPVSMEDLETEKAVIDNESTTTNEGISTWVLVSSPLNTSIVSTEPTKTEDGNKKQKPTAPKNKNNKKPPNKANPKRPVIGSTNKSDLIAGGSAINENIYNKIKDTVLTNVQKNKIQSTTKTTTLKTTTLAPTTETTTKKEETKAPAKSTKGTTKPKKKNKNKNKVSIKESPVDNDSAMLPMEAKEQEIELEVSTPPITTKKPKRSSTRKKTKTKKRKTSTKAKPEDETAVSDIKTSTNKTKSAKPGKKPVVPTTAVTTTLYNYFSREVMPSVGVGVLGLASLVGIASYFFYPFSTPVRRTFEVDKRDDLYKNNAEEYASEGNGQAEEEMLGTVLAGMPTYAKNKLNPYAGQTAYVNRYPVKKEQDIRYRQVATKYEPNYNVRYPQQKTGIAHAAVYSKPINYSPHYETRHAYTTEGKFNFDKLPTSYSNYNYPTVEPIYTAPQTGPSSSDISSYGSDASNSVVYGVKPSSETDFKPVYPFEGHFYSETTNSPATHAPTSLYLGSDNEAQTEEKIETSSLSADDYDESKFVVGNVPKELADSATPAVVPEHGPRNLNRKKRQTSNRRSISTSLEEIIKNERDNNVFLSNEIEDSYMMPIKNLASFPEIMPVKEDLPTAEKDQVFPIYTASDDSLKKDETTTAKTEVIESVSTVPIDNSKGEKPTESDSTNDLDTTTKVFRVYEVFSSTDASSSQSSIKDATKETTTVRNMMTETTTELKSETTSTMPSTAAAVTEPRDPLPSTMRPTPIYPDMITYPPSNQPGGFFSFLKRLVDFKVRLGLSILQNTSESLNRFLKSMENSTITQTTRKNQKIKEK